MWLRAPIADWVRACTRIWSGRSLARWSKARGWPRRRCGRGDGAADRLLRRALLARLGGVILPLDDAGGLAAAAAQIIELGAAHLAAAHDLDGIDHRRIEREHALDAFAVGDFPHREILVQAGAGAADADALIGLHAALFAFDDLDVDDDRIARLEIGYFLAGGELLHLFVFDFFEQIHDEFSIGCAMRRAAPTGV